MKKMIHNNCTLVTKAFRSGMNVGTTINKFIYYSQQVHNVL